VELKDILKVPEVRQFLTTTVSAKVSCSCAIAVTVFTSLPQNEDELLPNFVHPDETRRLSTLEESSDENESEPLQTSSGSVSAVEQASKVPDVVSSEQEVAGSAKEEETAAATNEPSTLSPTVYHRAIALHSYAGVEPGTCFLCSLVPPRSLFLLPRFTAIQEGRPADCGATGDLGVCVFPLS
jgi:hypothetical protein